MSDKVQAIIHGDNVRHNLAQVRQLAPHSRVLAIIKANAYGHGMGEIARLLNDADAYGVAHVNEGLQLRSVTTKPIVVLEGFLNADELTSCAQHCLSVVVHSLYQITLLEKTTLARPIQIWLKIDTGMHRLGIAPQDFLPALQRLHSCNNVTDIIAMSHFASAEETTKALTKEQITRFDECIDGTGLPTSLANSAGIMAWHNSHRDWLRPGLMLYGVSPIMQHGVSLKPAMTLQAPVISLRQIHQGESVGYNGRWTATRDSIIATVSAGYADGYPTQVPDGTPVLINGCMAKIAGRPSMDMTTIDVTDCNNIQVGDNAILWGEGLPIAEIAQSAHTIPYQLLTGVTARVQRVYQ